MVQKFHEIAKNHTNVHFRDKNFVITMFFCDYLRAAAPARTIHVVAPPIILTHGVGACKRKINQNNAEPFRILVLRQRLSIRLDALRRRDTYGRLLTFVIRCCERTLQVHARTCQCSLSASARCAAQHVATPTMSILNFREENFHDQKSNHENILPRKFGAIRYMFTYFPIIKDKIGANYTN